MSKKSAGYRGESASVKVGAGATKNKRAYKTADARKQSDWGDVGGDSGDGLMGQKVSYGTKAGGDTYHFAPKSKENMKPANARKYDSGWDSKGAPKEACITGKVGGSTKSSNEF